jgi:hypothetical protein
MIASVSKEEERKFLLEAYEHIEFLVSWYERTGDERILEHIETWNRIAEIIKNKLDTEDWEKVDRLFEKLNV